MLKGVVFVTQSTFTVGMDTQDKIEFDPFYSSANKTYIMKSVRELWDGKGKAHELIEVDDE